MKIVSLKDNVFEHYIRNKNNTVEHVATYRASTVTSSIVEYL